MTDFTTIQAFPVLPELAVLQNENIALAKSNRTLKWIIGGLAFIGLVSGICNKLKKGSFKITSFPSLGKNEKKSDSNNTGM